jgi:hypothetical protein
MSEVVRKENVYYLPAQPVEDPVPVPPRGWVALRTRFTRAWWRLRITIIEVRAAIRRPGRRLFADEAPIFLDRNAEYIERRRVRPAAPARVIDFATARGRLRPVVQG